MLGVSKETSDFWADSLVWWWQQVKADHAHVKRLLIRLDNAQVCKSNRRQWMKRLVEFADATGLIVELVYYPPYHSKYNPVERVWAALEKHWSGTLLSSDELVCEWAKTMSYDGLQPRVHLDARQYENGVTLDDEEWEQLQKRLKRTEGLEKWHVVIEPKPAQAE